MSEGISGTLVTEQMSDRLPGSGASPGEVACACYTASQPAADPQVYLEAGFPSLLGEIMMFVYREKLISWVSVKRCEWIRCVPTIDCNSSQSEKQVGSNLRGQSVIYTEKD